MQQRPSAPQFVQNGISLLVPPKIPNQHVAPLVSARRHCSKAPMRDFCMVPRPDLVELAKLSRGRKGAVEAPGDRGAFLAAQMISDLD